MRTSSNACRTMITTTTGGIYKNVYRCLSRGCQAEEYKCLYKFLLVLTKADKDTCNVTYIHDVAHLKRNWDKEKDSAARSLPRSFSAKLNAISMQFKVNRPKWAKEIVQPYTAIFTHIHIHAANESITVQDRRNSSRNCKRYSHMKDISNLSSQANTKP